VIVFIHHFMWLWFMLSSSKSSIMFKNHVSKQQPKSMMSLRNNFLPNMWWMLKHGSPTLLVKIFVFGDLPYSYTYLEKVLLSTQKTWIHSNMDFNIVLDMNILDMQFFSFHNDNDLQSSMGYQLGNNHGFQC
jgi:hypothetical protein